MTTDAASGQPGAAGNLPEPARMYPTARASGVTAAAVPLSTGYTTFLPEGGYPDVAEAANAYAAGQRAAARQAMSRNATTHPLAAPDPAAGTISPAAPGSAGVRVPPLNLPTPPETKG